LVAVAKARERTLDMVWCEVRRDSEGTKTEDRV
jgi:hypothetical protein